MKPLPKSLVALLQRPPGPIPNRPWWLLATNGTDLLREENGQKICHFSVPAGDDSRRWRMPVNAKEAAAIDKKHPLPHPGFFVGQLYGFEQEPRIARVATVCWVDERGARLWTPYACPDVSEAGVVLAGGEVHPVWLLGDPGRPWMPQFWGPV